MSNTNTSAKPELLIKQSTSSDSRAHELSVISIVRAAPHDVWELFSDYEDMPRWITGLQKAQVLEQKPNDMLVAFQMKLPFPVGRLNWTNRLRHNVDGGQFNIQWSYLEGDFKDNSGSLHLAPHNDGTEAQYNIRLEMETRIPMVAQKLGVRWLLPRVVDRLRRKLENSVGGT